LQGYTVLLQKFMLFVWYKKKCEGCSHPVLTDSQRAEARPAPPSKHSIMLLVGRYTVRRWEGGKREQKGRRCGEREEGCGKWRQERWEAGVDGKANKMRERSEAKVVMEGRGGIGREEGQNELRKGKEIKKVGRGNGKKTTVSREKEKR
jgi:hypothetical protein